MMAERLGGVQPSMILRLLQEAKRLQATGHPVIDLGIGEPDFKTPDHVKEAACQAIADNWTNYTVTPGLPALREAIAEKLRTENALRYPIEQISVSSGAKQAIFNAMMATVSPGDEAIIPSPYWSSYTDIVSLCGGVVVTVPCTQSQSFRISAAQLEAVITAKTKWLFINSPSNPTGSVYSADHLKELAAVVDRHPHVHILSDDIYEHLIFQGSQFTSIVNVAPQLKERVLLVNGVSKAFAMTGWRIGYCVGPKPLIDAINTVQGQSTTHACSISQAASLAALTGPKDFIKQRARAFEKRSDAVVRALSETAHLSVVSPQGAFYAYPCCNDVIGKTTPDGKLISNDAEFCAWLLDSCHVSTVPGAAFGLSPYFRISTAAANEDLNAACSRIAEACAQLRD